MNRLESDPVYTPAPVRMASPLIRGFCRSAHCPPEHRWHARSTLPVLALFVAMLEEPTTAGLAWAALEPDALLRAAQDDGDEERAFLRDLLEVSSDFYGYLAEERRVPAQRARAIRARLRELRRGLSASATSRGRRAPGA